VRRARYATVAQRAAGLVDEHQAECLHDSKCAIKRRRASMPASRVTSRRLSRREAAILEQLQRRRDDGPPGGLRALLTGQRVADRDEPSRL